MQRESAFTWLLLLVCLNQTRAAEVHPSGSSLVTIMRSTQQYVTAGLLQPLLWDGRYAIVRAQVSEPEEASMGLPQATTTWRVSQDTTYAVDCAGPVRALAIMQSARNIQTVPGGSPEWSVVRRSAHHTGPAGLAMHLLDFSTIPNVISPPSDWPQPLRAPSERQVVAAFGCSAAALPGATAMPASEVAAQVRQTGGYPDLQILRCQAAGRNGHKDWNTVLRYSPGGNAVLLNDQWVLDGVVHGTYLAMSHGELELRLTRSTGTLRLVSRVQSQTLGAGMCRTQWPN